MSRSIGRVRGVVTQPAFVEKRWRKRHTVYVDYLPFPVGYPFEGRVMCLYSPFDCTGFFSPTLEYRMMHDAVGGTDSMREMLRMSSISRLSRWA